MRHSQCFHHIILLTNDQDYGRMRVLLPAQMAELVDARDSKSRDFGHESSILSLGTYGFPIRNFRNSVICYPIRTWFCDDRNHLFFDAQRAPFKRCDLVWF